MIRHRKSSRKEKGQSMVELGFSLTFLLVLLAGIADIGRAYFTFVTLRDAAQEGASYGATHPSFCTQIRERVRSTSSDPVDLGSLADDDILITIGGVDCEVAVSSGLACAPNEIHVEVRVNDFELATPFLGTILGTQSLTLKADISDTVISNPCSSP